MMGAVMRAYGRALQSQFTGRMRVLSVLPFLLSVALWAVLLWFGLQPLMDWIQAQFASHEWFHTSSIWLARAGLASLRAVVVPLLAMLLMLPLMILTALVFIGVAAMPAIVRHVAARWHPALERKQGGTLLGSVLLALSSFALFVLLFLVSLPLYALPPLALVGHALLWGWLTARVMAYDALADHASGDERAVLTRRHRLPLLAIGVASGAAGAVPGLVWMSGAAAVVLFPFLAAVSIWLYVMVFIFTGLWFEHYCLQALADLRASDAAAPAPGVP
jgi:hypothetical protein